MVIIKSPFPDLILCCYLLVSFVFFPQGTVSRKLLGEEGGNGPSKAGVRKSKSQVHNQHHLGVARIHIQPHLTRFQGQAHLRSWCILARLRTTPQTQDGIAKTQLLIMFSCKRVRVPVPTAITPIHKVYVSF
ncbi:hypothetical protein Gotur_022532 [Gossypium turneri]